MTHLSAFIPASNPFLFSRRYTLTTTSTIFQKHSQRYVSPKMSTVPPPSTPGHTPPTPRENEPESKINLNDWRTFRAKLVLSHPSSLPTPPFWAHSIKTPEVGSLLLANPKYEWPSNFSYLKHSVILLTDINPNSSISGLLLTRPTLHTVSSHASVLARVGKTFANNSILLGGDCSTGSLEMLHPFSTIQCPGSQQIFPGLYRGGFNASRNLVEQQQAHASDFHFFVAYSTWTWKQFTAEMEKDAWNLAVCSADIILAALKNQGNPTQLWDDLRDMIV